MGRSRMLSANRGFLFFLWRNEHSREIPAEEGEKRRERIRNFQLPLLHQGRNK
jgi:hypothetical protein